MSCHHHVKHQLANIIFFHYFIICLLFRSQIWKNILGGCASFFHVIKTQYTYIYKYIWFWKPKKKNGRILKMLKVICSLLSVYVYLFYVCIVSTFWLGIHQRNSSGKSSSKSISGSGFRLGQEEAEESLPSTAFRGTLSKSVPVTISNSHKKIPFRKNEHHLTMHHACKLRLFDVSLYRQTDKEIEIEREKRDEIKKYSQHQINKQANQVSIV